MSDRPGFVSGAAIIVAAVSVVALLAWMLVAGPGLFSPGALNAQAEAGNLGGVTSHAQLGDCGACHTAPWSSRTMADRCVACHKEIGTELQSRGGLHGSLAWGTAPPTCRGCHPEHHGPSGALTAVDTATFPHDLTRYSLRGHRRTANGAKFTCAECHPRGLASFDQTTCAACHATLDAAFMSRHEASFGKTCLPCHDGTDRFGADFDHDKLPFKLTGKHAGVSCERCHADAGSIQALKTTPRDCDICHAKDDEHKGAFGRECGQCHATGSWENARFDHTIFPVDHGREERQATCQTCHPTDVSTYTCYGCHEHTPARVQGDHEGRAIAGLADCIRCHAGGRSEGGD